MSLKQSITITFKNGLYFRHNQYGFLLLRALGFDALSRISFSDLVRSNAFNVDFNIDSERDVRPPENIDDLMVSLYLHFLEMVFWNCLFLAVLGEFDSV